jgi:NAD(P)H-hydrate epimerase
MQALDRFTIERLGVPGEILMENAGRALVDFILGHAGEGLASRGAEVVLACGPGNNGGDGFVAARHLTQLGVAVRVVLLADPSGLKGEAAAHHAMAMAVGVPMEVMQSGEGGPLLRRGVLVDALFGTGLARPLEGRAAHLVERINALADTPEIVVIAVDLPSGIDADTGQPLGPAVAADATLTLGAPKIGLTLEPGRSLAGRVCVGKIGIADAIPGELPEEGAAAAQLWSPAKAGEALPPRPMAGHKGTFGHLLVVAGSEGMSGAAALAATAALRSGAGLVTLGCPAGLNDVIEAQCSEAMTVPLPETPERALAGGGLDAVLGLAAERDAVAMGPGVGRRRETTELLRGLAVRVDKPLVVDADGLVAFEGLLETLKDRSAPTVLTPHPGEAARLLGSGAEEVNRDRVGAARELAFLSGSVVLLKGAATVAASPDGRVIINPTGGPNLATGGSGDVLTGLVGALVVQGSAGLEAAAVAAYVHGRAGDRIAAKRGDGGLLAGELAEELPAAMQELRDRGREEAGENGSRSSTLLAFPGT